MQPPLCTRTWDLYFFCFVQIVAVHLFFWEVWVCAGMWACVAGCLRQWVAACQTQWSHDCDDCDRVEWLQALSSQSHVSAGWHKLFHVWPAEVPIVLWQRSDVGGSGWVQYSELSLCFWLLVKGHLFFWCASGLCWNDHLQSWDIVLTFLFAFPFKTPWLYSTWTLSHNVPFFDDLLSSNLSWAVNQNHINMTSSEKEAP